MARCSTSAWLARIVVAGSVAAASVAGLAGAASAPTYKPLLFVSAAPGGGVQFEVRRRANDLATWGTDIRVPNAYGASLDQPVGTVIGRVAAHAIGDGSASYSGTLTVTKGDPDNDCFTGTDTAWNVSLTNGTRSFVYVIYVLVHPGDATLLRYCLPYDARPLDSIVYTVTGVFEEPTRGTYAWRGQLYPYTPGGEVVDNDAGVGAAALVRLPHVVALAATYSRRTHAYVLRGSVTEAGVRVRNAAVQLLIGARGHALHAYARVLTDKRGTFTYSGKLPAKSAVRFRASARVPARVVSAPHCPAINGWPCVSETVSTWANDSRTIAVRP